MSNENRSAFEEAYVSETSRNKNRSNISDNSTKNIKRNNGAATSRPIFKQQVTESRPTMYPET